MSWVDRMNRAMEDIEDNLGAGIDLSRAAACAGQTATGFARVFSIVTDMPLSEYIRKRRLTQAAFELQNSTARVIDVALKYGYESPEAFARAFSALHGVSPSAARDKGVLLKSYPRISFQFTVKGVSAMDYRIEEKKAFCVYGIEGIFTTENGENLKEIPLFWGQTMEDGRFQKLLASTNAPDENELLSINAVCGYRETGGNTFPYMIFAFKTELSDTTGFTEVEIPAATWAIFRSKPHPQDEVSSATQELIRRVYTEWLPASSYDLVEGFDLELYYREGEKFYEEACIRVRPKENR